MEMLFSTVLGQLPSLPLLFALLGLGYLVGSVPFSFFIAKMAKGLDIREHGSGNVGATNVLRTCGKIPGALAYALDGLKGLIPVLLVKSVLPAYPLLHVLVALSLVVGHSRSVFLGFKGGKASMTGLGGLLALAPLAGLATGAVAVATIMLTKTVSLGSLAAAVTTAPLAFLLGAPLPYVVYAGLTGLVVTVRHKANIQRLLAGTEAKFN